MLAPVVQFRRWHEISTNESVVIAVLLFGWLVTKIVIKTWLRGIQGKTYIPTERDKKTISTHWNRAKTISTNWNGTKISNSNFWRFWELLFNTKDSCHSLGSMRTILKKFWTIAQYFDINLMIVWALGFSIWLSWSFIYLKCFVLLLIKMTIYFLMIFLWTLIDFISWAKKHKICPFGKI